METKTSFAPGMFNPSGTVLVFKTDIALKRHATAICRHLELSGLAFRCSVDTEDCDKVLRAECPGSTCASAIVSAVEILGHFIEELPD